MQAPNEKIGNTDSPKYYLRVQYCGGWGYKRYCIELEAKLKEKFGDVFCHNLYMDEGTTGNFEVTLQKTENEDAETDKPLWSKK